MSMAYDAQFLRCTFCGKPEIPPGIVVFTYGSSTTSPYCQGHPDRVCCPHCGSMVHPHMHPFRACQYFHAMYDTSAWLRYDTVLKEAEAILKEARGDERWEGAD